DLVVDPDIQMPPVAGDLVIDLGSHVSRVGLRRRDPAECTQDHRDHRDRSGRCKPRHKNYLLLIGPTPVPSRTIAPRARGIAGDRLPGLVASATGRPKPNASSPAPLSNLCRS